MHPPDYGSARPQHTVIGACGTQWGYAVVPEHPHTPRGIWVGLMHHQTAHTDHPRHISVDSDPHSHARATCRTPRRAWLTDLIRVIWTCLRVLAVAWTCGYLGPSAWTTWGRYMTVERRYCNGQVVVVWWSVWSCFGVGWSFLRVFGNCNRLKALQPAVLEQLTEYGPWSSGPDAPTPTC